jgi:hypothetical protein
VTDPTQETSFVEERRRYYSRALRAGLGVSLVFHLLVILVLGRALSLDPASFTTPPRQVIQVQGMPVVQVDEVLPAETSNPDALRLPPEDVPEEDPADDGQPVESAVFVPQGPALLGPPRLTNAERLQPREGDDRLWQEFEGDSIAEYIASNPYARYEGEIRARLSLILDSLSLSEEQRRRATEWLSGDEGEEWGVSPEGIHIAGMIIPINLSQLLAEEGPNGRESRQTLRDLRDIQFQDLIGDAQDVQQERAREMRERSQEEIDRRTRDSLEAVADSL